MKNALRYAAVTAAAVLFVFAATSSALDVAGLAPTIVIDPGHGGDDAGAIGPDGIKEKDITLKVAKELEKELAKSLDARIILTRTDDTFIPLEQRTVTANKEKADIFISIHANAAYRPGANGVETFFLNFEASDSDSRELAALENNVIGADAKGGGDDDLQSILWDLVQTEAHHESALLAETVYDSLIGATRGLNRGVKQAPFVVLAGATMPATLVEIGFISNPAEEKKLADPDVQKTIARAIAEGVVRFGKELKKRDGLMNAAGPSWTAGGPKRSHEEYHDKN
ncbi:MAG: N-acetylmuramoyl-L-alanine amidase [Deltaproteobacteria bacterium]|nr:N-acetylmuramoyl-L-alanine amidase [Deltaproteobacteria bacterium]